MGRRVESVRLEKTSEIMKSNCHPNPPLPAKPCPQSATSTRVLNPSRDGDPTTALGSLVQCFTTLSKEIFPNIQSKPPLMELEAMASRPVTGYLGEETNPRLTTPAFQRR